MKPTMLLAILFLLSGCFPLKQGHVVPREDNSRSEFLRPVIEMILCERFPGIFEKARCPDSTHFYPLADNNLLVTHSFFGSGNGMLVYLWDLAEETPKILDSLFLYIDSDIKPSPTLVFNDSCNWFVAKDQGGGTNHFSENAYWVRVEDRGFNVLLTLLLYASDINPESTPMAVQWFKLELLESSETRIVVKAEMVYGILIESEGEEDPDAETDKKITDRAEDIAVFVYDASEKRFIWQSSSNPLFIRFWRDNAQYRSILSCY